MIIVYLQNFLMELFIWRYRYISICRVKCFMKFVVSVEGVKEFDTRWIGWAGVNVPDEVGQKALTKALAEMVLIIVCIIVEFEQI